MSNNNSLIKTYHTVLTHRLHIDEVLAFIILLLFGKKKGIDIASAKIELVYGNSLPDGKSVEQLDREGVLVIGEGNGRFDEHERRACGEKTCAALLVARYLGVAKLPGLKMLLDEICEFDCNPTATKTCLGTVLKDCFVARRRQQEEIFRWAIEGVRDMVDWSLQNGSIALDYEAYAAVFSRAWNDAAQSGDWTNDIYERAAKDFVASSANQQKLLTDLSYVYFYRVAKSGKEKADAWLYDAVYDLIVYQKKWSVSLTEFLAKARIEHTNALVNGNNDPQGQFVPLEKRIKIAFIVSDSEMLNKVFVSTKARNRFGTIDALVQKKTSGNVAIFFNHQSKLPSDNLARMLRWAEIAKTQRSPSGWDKLNRGDMLDFVPEWYYHRGEIGKAAFYNGSLSHPLVKPTRIRDDVLAEIVCHAFHPEGVMIWRKRYSAFDPVRRDQPGHRGRPQHDRKVARQPSRSSQGIPDDFAPEVEISLGSVIDQAEAKKRSMQK